MSGEAPGGAGERTAPAPVPVPTPPEPRARASGAPAAPPAVEHEPIDAVALAKEVVLDRLEHLLESLLARLRRYRARRGNWWERG